MSCYTDKCFCHCTVLGIYYLTQARQVQRLQRTISTSGLIVRVLQIHGIEIRVACAAREEVQLSWIGGNDSISLQRPVSRSRGGVEAERLVGSCRIGIHVQV